MKTRASARGCILWRREDLSSEALSHGEQWLEIGEVTRRHGLRGHFRVRLHNPDSESLSEIPGSAWRLKTRAGQMLDKITLLRAAGDFLIMRVAGLDDLGRVDELKGAGLMVPRGMISVGKDEFLCLDLMGCLVFQDNRCLGRVEGIFCGGASEVLVVRDFRQAERLIPFVSDWVGEIDLVKRRIEIFAGEDFLSTG